MTEPTYLLCDICGEKLNRGHKLYLPTDRQMDGAGSMEDVGQYVDICPNHAIDLIRFLLQETRNTRPNYELGKKCWEWVKSKSRK